MVSGAPVQRVSQTSLHNLLTLEAEEEQPKKISLSSAETPFPASCLLAESNPGHLGQHW